MLDLIGLNETNYEAYMNKFQESKPIQFTMLAGKMYSFRETCWNVLENVGFDLI